MASVVVAKRVHKLEELMANLIATVERTDRQLAETDRQLAETDRQLAETDRQLAKTALQAQRTERSVERLSEEMREFKQEMRHDMQELSQRMGTERQKAEKRRELERQKAEERYQEKLEEYRRERRADIKAMNKQWGELSNKMGTMAEDLVAPSVGRILKETVGCQECEIEYQAVRVKKHHPETRKNREYDVVVVCGDYLLINETKSQLKPEDVEKFVEVLSEARDFFPEYADKQVIGALGSLYVDKSLVRCGERAGLIVLGFGEDVMEVLNSKGFVPKSF